MEDPFVSIGFSIVTEEVASHEDWGMGFSSVKVGASNEEYWTTCFSSVIEGVSLRVRNEVSRLGALFFGIRGVVKTRKDIP
jgi:hypothetical protein